MAEIEQLAPGDRIAVVQYACRRGYLVADAVAWIPVTTGELVELQQWERLRLADHKRETTAQQRFNDEQRKAAFRYTSST